MQVMTTLNKTCRFSNTVGIYKKKKKSSKCTMG